MKKLSKFKVKAQSVNKSETTMFKNTFQSGFLSILYSIGSKPLQIWDKKVRNGHIKRITDNDIQSLVLEILGSNVSTTYITCPADPRKTLGIKLPFLVMIIKNLKKYFTFEVQVRFFSGLFLFTCEILTWDSWFCLYCPHLFHFINGFTKDQDCVLYIFRHIQGVYTHLGNRNVR